MTDSDRIFTIEGRHPVAKRRALRSIAVFEAAKGIAALAAIIGVLDLMHRDVRHLAIELIGRFGPNPDAHYPSIILHYADLLPDTNGTHAGAPRLGLHSCAPARSLRTLERSGLGRKWLGALSGAVYIPLEISYLTHRPSVISAAVLAGNVIVVSFLVFQLWRRLKNNTIYQQSFCDASSPRFNLFDPIMWSVIKKA